MKDADSDALYKRSMQVRKWSQQNRVDKFGNLDVKFGKIVMPTKWMKLPDVDFRDRRMGEAHRDQVAQSVRARGVQNTELVGLIWKGDLIKNGYKEDGSDVEMIVDQKGVVAPINLHIHTIVGAHTVNAIQKLHIDKPRHIDYKFVHVVLIIADENDEAHRLANIYGSLDNVLKEMSKKKSAWECVNQMHDWMVNNNKRQVPDAQKRAAELQYFRDAPASMNYKAASIGSLKQVAVIMGKLWDNIYKIFK